MTLTVIKTKFSQQTMAAAKKIPCYKENSLLLSSQAEVSTKTPQSRSFSKQLGI